MLREWLSSQFTQTTSPAARRLGYADEVAALAARHRRCAQAWHPHVESTRRVLLEQGRRHGQQSALGLLLGAGLLNDIPWEGLAGHFARLNLVDAAFPAATLRLAARYSGRLRLIAHDLTGVVDKLESEGAAAIPDDRLSEAMLEGVHWIASVNCLTQLPLLPVAWALQRGIDEAAAEALGQAIIAAHLRQLEATRRPCCIIAEREDHRYDRDGRRIGHTDYGPLLDRWLQDNHATLLAEWDWQVHPPAELPRGETETRRVAAWSVATP